MAAFDYPRVAHERRHGPQGYKQAFTFRPWLREGRSPDARRLIAIFGLDSPSYRHLRSIWLRNVELAEAYDRDHFRRIMGFPDDLPRLDRSPPVNTRPEGVQQSWYAKRQRGELPDVY
jgi:hypothetical protein